MQINEDCRIVDFRIGHYRFYDVFIRYLGTERHGLSHPTHKFIYLTGHANFDGRHKPGNVVNLSHLGYQKLSAYIEAISFKHCKDAYEMF